MIEIKKPTIKTVKEKTVLETVVLIDNKAKTVFYEIDKKYGKYLCTERSDAYVIAALYYAMKNNHNIKSEMPISRSLYHNITTYLIPTLSKHSNRLHHIKLDMEIAYEELETEGNVGTGMSCGIDSFHTLHSYLNPECKDMKLTHLCLNNVGSFNAYNEKYHGIGSDNARDFLIERACKVAKEINLPLIITNSNIHKVFNENYFRVHTFANMFSVFLMQKFFRIYYYSSSGYDLSYYNVKDSWHLDSAEYDLLTFFALQTNGITIYPEGIEKTRLEKTISIADFKPAENNLHVCIKEGNNCNTCMKCKRTILALDAIGKLDNFKKVFDVDYYYKHKEEYISWLENELENDSQMNKFTALLIKQKEGKTEYSNIEKFNDKNIILPKTMANCISIKEKERVLSKNNTILHDSNLYSNLQVCIEIAKLKNKEIEIPKHYLGKVKSKIKTIMLKRKTKINLYDLIYFILFKNSKSSEIIKYLFKENYIKLSKKDLKTKFTIDELLDVYNNAIKYDIIKEAFSIDTIKIKGKVLKHTNFMHTCKDNYYKKPYLKNTLQIIENGNYYFLGQEDNYTIAISSKYSKKKIEIYKAVEDTYGLIKKLNEK